MNLSVGSFVDGEGQFVLIFPARSFFSESMAIPDRLLQPFPGELVVFQA
jgi:hypothetical protein